MEDAKTTQSEVENQTENENSLNDSNQTDEGAEGQESDSENVEKQEGDEENPYAAKLKQFEDELAKEKAAREAEKQKQQEIIEHKNRALEAEKTKNKKLNAQSSEELEELVARKAKELIKPLEEKLHAGEVQEKINSITSDADERKLIKHLYDNAIVKTGNLDRDLSLAVGAANAENVLQQRKNQMEMEGRENFLVQFQSTSQKGSSSNPTIKDPIKRAAAELVNLIDPRAVKHLK